MGNKEVWTGSGEGGEVWTVSGEGGEGVDCEWGRRGGCGL